MKRNRGGVLAGAAFLLATCGPIDDGGGGVVGDPCNPNIPGQCVSNACCGNGTGVVNLSSAPTCPAPNACPAGSPDPTNQTLLNGCGTPYCDTSGHCVIARQC